MPTRIRTQASPADAAAIVDAELVIYNGRAGTGMLPVKSILTRRPMPTRIRTQASPADAAAIVDAELVIYNGRAGTSAGPGGPGGAGAVGGVGGNGGWLIRQWRGRRARGDRGGRAVNGGSAGPGGPGGAGAVGGVGGNGGWLIRQWRGRRARLGWPTARPPDSRSHPAAPAAEPDSWLAASCLPAKYGRLARGAEHLGWPTARPPDSRSHPAAPAAEPDSWLAASCLPASERLAGRGLRCIAPHLARWGAHPKPATPPAPDQTIGGVGRASSAVSDSPVVACAASPPTWPAGVRILSPLRPRRPTTPARAAAALPSRCRSPPRTCWS